MTSRLIRDKPRTLAQSLAARRRGRPKLPLTVGLGFGMLAVMLGVQTFSRSFGAVAAPGVRQAQAATPDVADCPSTFAPLQRQLGTIAGSFDGAVGIAVAKVGCDWVAGERLDEFFPQQSVSKLWVSLAVLDAVDRGRMRLDETIAIGPGDLTLFHQPLRQEVVAKGAVSRTAMWLMTDALSHSDNTANDRLLWTVGGPARVRAVLEEKGLAGIRFGPGERLLQSRIAGVTWTQDLALGRNFYDARQGVPMAVRKAALESYLADPMDGATPAAMVRALARLAGGELLSPRSTAVMMDILSRTRSGPRRLKGGAPEGWSVYHKTGTGQVLGADSTGYNDVGVLQAPDGTRYAVAVMIARTRQPIPARMEMMQQVTRAVAAFHEEDGRVTVAGRTPDSASQSR